MAYYAQAHASDGGSHGSVSFHPRRPDLTGAEGGGQGRAECSYSNVPVGGDGRQVSVLSLLRLS